jgi:hypothetical protein
MPRQTEEQARIRAGVMTASGTPSHAVRAGRDRWEVRRNDVRQVSDNRKGPRKNGQGHGWREVGVREALASITFDRCWLCAGPLEVSRRGRLGHVDHEEVDGLVTRVRGLLDRRCNTFIPTERADATELARRLEWPKLTAYATATEDARAIAARGGVICG